MSEFRPQHEQESESAMTHPDPIVSPPSETPSSPPYHTEPDAVTATHPDDFRVDLTRPRRFTLRRPSVRTIFLFVGALLVTGLVTVGVYAYSFAKTQITEKDNQAGFFTQVHNIIDTNANPLQGETEDRINVVLVGQGGKGHAGGTLMDTIMVVSYKPSTKQVAMVSIPRDLVVAFPTSNPKYPDYLKINGAYEYGGMELAIQKVSEVTGLPIHYYARVDFEGFRKIINDIEGIDITVKNAFTGLYGTKDMPTPCSRTDLRRLNDGSYCAVAFEAGEQHMDGERALMYARIRKLDSQTPNFSEEGSDFARAQRQHTVILAVRQKMLSSSTLFNPATLTRILQDVGDHVETNIELWEMARFGMLAQELDLSAIHTEVIDNSPEGLLYSTRSEETGAYILIPNAGLGDYSDIQTMTAGIFGTPSDTAVAEGNTDEEGSSSEDSADETPSTNVTIDPATLTAEDAVVVVQNGTRINGLASHTAEELGALGVEVPYVANAKSQNQSKTRVYDLSGGTKPLTADIINDFMRVEAIAATMPVEGSTVRVGTDIDTSIVNIASVPADADFVIVLGADAETLFEE
jgi:LCP family protein required for cell wall assembly